MQCMPNCLDQIKFKWYKLKMAKNKPEDNKKQPEGFINNITLIIIILGVAIVNIYFYYYCNFGINYFYFVIY